LTTTGFADFFSKGSAACVSRTIETAMVSNTFRASGPLRASIAMPALLTSTSNPPSTSIWAKAAATEASSVTSGELVDYLVDVVDVHVASVAWVFPAVTNWYTVSAGPPPEP
jgi:hypothetical protein